MVKKKAFILLSIILSCIFSLSAFALEFSGEAGAGGAMGINGSGSGFALVHASTSCNGNSIIGYRFSIYDKNLNKRGVSIDIYRSGAKQNGSICECTGSICTCKNQVPWSQFGYNGYSLVNASGVVLDKLENKAAYHQQKGFWLQKVSQNKYIETGLLLASYFPNYDYLHTWLAKEQNIDVVVTLCLGKGKALNYKDILLVEPIYCCFVAHLSCGLTISDLARVSNYYYGNVFPQAASGATEFAWIRSWVLYYFPNMLSITDSAKANGIGLKTGTKLKGGTNPSRLIDGAYGMVMCTELSESTAKPKLLIEKITIYDQEKKVEELSPATHCETTKYLTPGKEYRFVIKTSQETTPYPCELTFSMFGAMEKDFYLKGLSSNTWEINVVLGNADKNILLEAGEDWISENGDLIQKGKVATFTIRLCPKIETTIEFLNQEGQKIDSAYKGQVVTAKVTQRSKSNWAKGCTFETEGFGDKWLVSSEYLKETTKTFEFKMQKESSSFAYSITTKWKEKNCMLEQMEGSLPVFQAELEIVGISLWNELGEQENPEQVSVGKRIWPSVAIKSNLNTPATVLVNYSLDGVVEQSFKVSLEHAMEIVKMNSFVLSEEKKYEFSVGVILPECEDDESIEEDLENNTKSLVITAVEPLQMEVLAAGIVMPEETIISAIKIENKSFEDLCGNNKAWVKLKRANGDETNVATATLVCPINQSTYLPIKWQVPKDALDGEVLTLSFEYILFHEERSAKKLETKVKVQKELFTEQEDTSFRAPQKLESFVKLAKRLNEKYTDNSFASGEVAWHTWRYDEENGFAKDEFKLTYSLTTSIVEADHSVCNPEEQLQIKSGYGLVLKSEWKWSLTKNNRRCAGYEWISDESRVSYLYFENAYQEAATKCTQIKDFTKTIKHYTPVWTPNGVYTIFMKMGGFWTPAGEITCIGKVECQIEGSIFDDYFVTQG